MTGMLTSVQNLEEAQLMLVQGADIIDLKAPTRGALGAIAPEEVSHIVKAIHHECPLSATIGDLPMDPQAIHHAVRTMASTRVDYVKIGFFPDGDKNAALDLLKTNPILNTRLIAVLFADDYIDLADIGNVSNAGFAGVMVDTMDKSHGRLTDLLTVQQLQQFVEEAKRHQLLCGLAGSLRFQDIATLLPLAPDYLGFRSALCQNHTRTDNLDPAAIKTLKCAMSNNQPKAAQRYQLAMDR